MSRLTESAIENFAIKLFEHLDYSYVYASDIASDDEYPVGDITVRCCRRYSPTASSRRR